MTQEHDPELQANNIGQCLAEDKRPIGQFLGAGCPTAIEVQRNGAKEPLIPAIAGMTADVEKKLLGSGLKDLYGIVCIETDDADKAQQTLV